MWENIPQELKFNALWCCWKKTEKGKIPYDVKFKTLAKSNDRHTFYNFKTILNHVQEYLRFDENGKQVGGIGLGIFEGYSAIDIDHCIDENGKISDMAQEIIDYCQSYTEKSPSKTGIRIIFKSDLKDFDKKKWYINNSKIGLEVYIEGATNKFVTITGDVLYPCEIVNVDITYILNKYMLKKQRQTPQVESINYINNTDIEVFLNKDKKLNELWYSRASGFGGNESNTDLALCTKLAFYCNRDFEQIATAFENSPYFQSKDEQHKEKWLVRQDYKINTINTAIESCTAVYNPNYSVQTGGKYQKVYSLTDTGNSHRFVDKFSDDIRYNVDNNAWMIWNGKYWQFDVFKNIKNYAELMTEEMKIEAFSLTDLEQQKEILKNVNRLYSSSGKEAMLKEAQHLDNIPVGNDSFDKDDFLFNCANGVIDLKTGNLLKHSKSMLLNKYSDVEYTNETPTRFLEFLNEILNHDADVIDYMQKLFGYAMTGSTKEQKMWMFVGDGSNGKSLLLQIISEVLGDYAASTTPELLLDEKTQAQNFSALARLKGKRTVITSETKLGDKLNEKMVKTMTGGNDKLTARFLYANEFEFYPKMKIFMATNYDPVIRGVDNGIWRRIVKIKFDRIFTEDEQDVDLIDKLRLEKSGILNWMVQGCLKWQADKRLKEPDAIKNNTKEYRTDMDIVQRWLDERCTINVNAKEKASILYGDFKTYLNNTGEYPMTMTMFGRNFGKKFKKKVLNGNIIYMGVELKNDI